MRRSPLACAIALAFFSGYLAAQDAPAARDDTPAASVPLTYVGANTRLSLGVDDDLNVVGELLRIFGADADSAWLLEGWAGSGGAGGLKLDYHFARGAERPVLKFFGALDQNAFDDRKATLGVGFERDDNFVDVYASGALTDERLASTTTTQTTRTITGNDAGRPFRQTETTTTTLRAFEEPYGYGVGARAGHWFDDRLARVRAGLDYEDGEHGASQATLSLGFDKYLANTGHSFTLELEHAERDGDFERDDAETRAWLLWRYDFGNAYRRAEPAYREVRVPREVTVEIPAEPTVVRNDVRLDTESFFDFDKSVLKPEAIAALDAILDELRADNRVSKISVVGHTCDIGTDAYNQALSERRANAVRAYFESHGVAVAELDVRGAGESQPKYPNDGEANRRKNRRVDVSFLTIEESREAAAPRTETRTEYEIVREPVPASPDWIERALRNPSEHKRTVDVYRFEETDVDVTLGAREFLNRAPIALDDLLRAGQCLAEYTVPVLANDSDPDGDAIRIVSVGAIAGATASANPNGTVTVRPATGSTFCAAGGRFSYTISDVAGLTASATARIEIANNPPDAQDDTAQVQAGRSVEIDVLANDRDPDGDPLVLGVLGTAANGTVVPGPGRRVTYTPRAGFTGVDTFTYRIADGRGGSDEARVTVTVTATSPSNRPPLAVADSYTVLGAIPTILHVLENDSDPDGDAIEIVSMTMPANGVANVVGNGTIWYRSNPGYCGPDTFTYTIRDPSGATSTATVTLNVVD